MNIFILDKDPKQAAKYMCDKHVVKMVLETAQILCTKHENHPYKLTHVNHPSCVWARESKANYNWLIEHGFELSKEYTKRYKKVHKSSFVIKWCQDNINNVTFDKKELTPFAVAVPEKFKRQSAIESYRLYYRNEKNRIATWKTAPPKWWYEKKYIIEKT